MRVTVCLAIMASLAIGGAAAAAAPKGPAKEINKTSWAFSDDGKKIRMSIDEQGRYVEETIAGKHQDHGAAAMKDGKYCFTSAMNNDGETCWSSKALKVGQSMVTTSDKGKKLKVTRVAYRPLAFPK